MKKTILWFTIFLFALTLVSCAVPDGRLSTTTENTTLETTTVCGGDCTTTDYQTTQGCDDGCTTGKETSELDVFPPAPTETNDAQPTCNTGGAIEPTPVIFTPPTDEVQASITHGTAIGNGLSLEVTLYGYQSESLGNTLYFKNNEPIEMKITLKNETDAPIYQWQPTMCHGMTPAHNHELSILFADKNGNKLANMNVEYYYTGCPQALEVWHLEAGESYEWNLKYFAGYAKENVIWKDPICDTEFSTTFEYYDSDIYTDGACLFEGTVDFAFGYESNGYENCNDQKLSVPLSLKVFYVGE